MLQTTVWQAFSIGCCSPQPSICKAIAKSNDEDDNDDDGDGEMVTMVKMVTTHLAHDIFYDSRTHGARHATNQRHHVGDATLKQPLASRHPFPTPSPSLLPVFLLFLLFLPLVPVKLCYSITGGAGHGYLGR